MRGSVIVVIILNVKLQSQRRGHRK